MFMRRKLILLFFTALLVAGCNQYKQVADDLSFLTPDKFQCTVLKVYSGDRFLCQLPGLNDEKVKLLGVEIPETKKTAAKKYTESVLRRGTLIEIEPGKETRNSEGDIPAYVIIPGGRMLNLVLVEKGLAEINIEEFGKYKSSVVEIKQDTKVEIIEEDSK